MEDSPSGLWRTLGKRVGVTASRVRISYPPLAGFSDDSESLFFMPENGSLSAIPTNLAHMPFCRVMPSNDVGNADIGDTHDGPNRCVTLTSKGTPACSLIPVRGHMHLTLPASAFSSVDVTLRVYTCLHWFTLFTGLDFSLLVQRLWMMWAHGFPGTMVFACDDRVSGGPMGRYARLALAEREEIVLLRHGGELRRDGRSDGRGQSDRQRGDGRKLVRRWLGAVPSCIDRPAWLRVPKGFLRAARGPRRRARGGACAASCRAGALVARADRGRDRGRVAGTDGLCVRYLQGDQRAAA